MVQLRVFERSGGICAKVANGTRAESLTMCQTAFSVMPSTHALPTLFTLRNSFLDQFQPQSANR